MNKKTKVLFLLEAFDKGGIEKVTLDIVNHLDPEKYDITVQTFWYGGHCQSLVSSHVKVIPFFFRRYVRGIIRLIQYLPPKVLHSLFVRKKYDIEIACSDGGAAKVISGSSNPNSKKICWVHMDVVERGSQLKEFRNADSAKPIYSKFDRITCVSQKSLERFKEKFGEFPNMLVVHNPLPDTKIRELSCALPVKRKKNVEFVTVGRLEEVKGFDRLIMAAARLKNDNFDFHIRIVGDGGKHRELENYIYSKHLEDVITLEGFRSNPYPYIAASDWYVCSSLDEGCPLTIGEAFCLSVPVLGTDCSGVQEYLENGCYGIVMENSTDGIYRGLKQALLMRKEEYNYWKQSAKNKANQICFEREFARWQQDMLKE